MKELQVIFQTPREIAQFVQIAARLPGEIDVTLENRTVSGKDMLGMFTLELRRQLVVGYTGSDEDFEAFSGSIRPFLA